MQRSPLILASNSPRRKRLLEQIGLEFFVIPSHVHENIDEECPPEEHVRILSERKATEVSSTIRDGIIIAADTIVVLEGTILNKPIDEQDAIDILLRLSGKRHDVFTGICLLESSSGRKIVDHEKTEVWFRELEFDEIRSYVRSGGPMDKAGAYGIQDDFGAVFVEKIHGDYYTVVGLPLTKVYLHLRHLQKNWIRK